MTRPPDVERLILDEEKAQKKRALRRIRRAVTEAIEWNEVAAFAGGGDPDLIDYKQYRAKRARETLNRILEEEL